MTARISPAATDAELTEGSILSGRILVIDEEIPWPANTGKRLRTLNLLSCLAPDFRIDLLVHGGAVQPSAIEEMRRRGITVHLSESRIAPKVGPLMPLRIAASLLRRLPYSVYSHYYGAYKKCLDALVEANNYDLIHCEWTPYAIYLKGMVLPVCIAAHNVEFAIWRRMADAERRQLHRQLFRIQAALMERFERRVFSRWRYVTAVSTGDAEIIRGMGTTEVAVVPNGVDAVAYGPPSADTSLPRSIVFTGSMDWRPNQDAIRWFIDAVHPLLLQQGDYRLHVVGRMRRRAKDCAAEVHAPRFGLEGGCGFVCHDTETAPNLTEALALEATLRETAFAVERFDAIRDRTAVPSPIVVTGTVEDVRPFIENAAVYVVPLRAGGGSRLKILEALAMGRAVVSTTVGAEGLDVEPGRNIVIEDTREGFAAAITALWDDAPRRAALGANGRSLIEERYRWEQIAPLQRALWSRAISDGAVGSRASSPSRIDQR